MITLAAILALAVAGGARGSSPPPCDFVPQPPGCPTDTPTATATVTFTATPTPTLIDTATPTSTPTSTLTNTPTSTSTATDTPSPTPTSTFTPTPTTTSIPTPVATPTATIAPTPTRIPGLADIEVLVGVSVEAVHRANDSQPATVTMAMYNLGDVGGIFSVHVTISSNIPIGFRPIFSASPNTGGEGNWSIPTTCGMTSDSTRFRMRASLGVGQPSTCTVTGFFTDGTGALVPPIGQGHVELRAELTDSSGNAISDGRDSNNVNVDVFEIIGR